MTEIQAPAGRPITTAAAGTNEWLQARAGKIGGSSAANILCGGMPDVPTRGTPLSEFVRIKQELEWLASGADPKEFPKGIEPVDEEADYIRWGNDSEPLHRKMLGRETGLAIEPFGAVLQGTGIEFLAGSPDALIRTDAVLANVAPMVHPDGNGIAELKAPSFQTATWRAGVVPMSAQIQLGLYLYLADLNWGLISGLVVPAPIWTLQERSDKAEAWMLEGLEKFWIEHIEADTPPDPVASAKDVKAAKALFQDPSGADVVQFDDALRADVDTDTDLRAQIKALQGERERIKANIILTIGEEGWGYARDGEVFHYGWEGEDKVEMVEKVSKRRLVLRKQKKLPL